MIALSMGERGQIVRLLAAKYGGHLTFAAMSPERASAPGQPDIGRLAGLFNYRKQVRRRAVVQSRTQGKTTGRRGGWGRGVIHDSTLGEVESTGGGGLGGGPHAAWGTERLGGVVNTSPN